MLPFALPTFFDMNPVFFFPPTFAWKLCQSCFFVFASTSFSIMRCLPLNALACFRFRSRTAWRLTRKCQSLIMCMSKQSEGIVPSGTSMGKQGGGMW